MTSNQIGRLALMIAAHDLSRMAGGQFRRPLFRVSDLGDKYPSVDFLVDAIDQNDYAEAFFFAQVKGTLRSGGKSLPVSMDGQQYARLARLTAPAFVIAVDVSEEKSYITAVDRLRTAPPSAVKKTFCLRDDMVRMRLYREVLAYWQVRSPGMTTSEFSDA